jgi:hypothetical protein
MTKHPIIKKYQNEVRRNKNKRWGEVIPELNKNDSPCFCVCVCVSEIYMEIINIIKTQVLVQCS